MRILPNFPALFIPDLKAIVISDLHLGLEHELYKKGIVIPPQANKFSKLIDGLLNLTGAEKLIITGDIKHKVPGISFRELKQIPIFFFHLMKRVEILICLGNHDTYLRRILPKVKIYPSHGFRIEKYGFFHGHAWPSKDLMNCKYLFIGHIHPAIEFKSKFFRSIERVWLKGELDKRLVKKRYNLKKTGKLKITILPSFNNLLGGIAVNSKINKKLIGPILANKFLDISKSKVYLLDGTLLGEVEDLKID
jgi:hypothetical protein